VPTERFAREPDLPPVEADPAADGIHLQLEAADTQDEAFERY
jgi:hypothetical protein